MEVLRSWIESVELGQEMSTLMSHWMTSRWSIGDDLMKRTFLEDIQLYLSQIYITPFSASPLTLTLSTGLFPRPA
jgi:hypothetical protein